MWFAWWQAVCVGEGMHAHGRRCVLRALCMNAAPGLVCAFEGTTAQVAGNVVRFYVFAQQALRGCITTTAAAVLDLDLASAFAMALYPLDGRMAAAHQGVPATPNPLERPNTLYDYRLLTFFWAGQWSLNHEPGRLGSAAPPNLAHALS